jgi:PST family polysaccharide transporter
MTLTQTLKRLSSNQFARNVGWLGGAELVQRVFRLATTVTLARVFTPEDYGMVSAIYTTFEFGNVLCLRGGIGAKVVQASDSELAIITNTSYWLNWLLCGAIALIQCALAYPIAQFYGSSELFLPICVLALSYLILPVFLVQSSLVERENRLHVRAWGSAAQTILSNLIMVVLAALGWGVWAVVWAIVCSYPVWIFITYRNHDWRPRQAFNLNQWQDILRFGSQMLGVELLNRIRFNIDYLLVAHFLGLEVLGLYFFAFNAGLGISLSVIGSLTLAWYPHFCQVRTDLNQLKQRYFGSFKTILTIVVPIVLLQTSLAPLYVPIVFGPQWTSAIPILILICFSAIPIALSRANSQLLQTLDQIVIDLRWNVIFTVFFAVCIYFAVSGGITWVGITVLLTQAICVPLFTIWVIHYVFGWRS